jgi:Kef-type K+ transport system membrane component KefB
VSELTSTGRGARILGVGALTDLVAGIVLSVVGVSSDNQTLAIVGVVLLIFGAGMLAFVVWMRNKPEAL